MWCIVVQPNCSCTFPPIADNGNSFGIDIGTIPPLLSHFIPPELSFTKTFIANTAAVKKVGIIIIIILPDMVTGQQQKSPSMLHTAGTPQSHLSFGVNSNMTVTFNLNTEGFFYKSLCDRWQANETTASSSCDPGSTQATVEFGKTELTLRTQTCPPLTHKPTLVNCQPSPQ